MIERMGRGPSNAQVEEIEVEDTSAENRGRFELRR
jgi:hypothetical protein